MFGKKPMSEKPLIIGLGGAVSENSSTSHALRCVLTKTEAMGARTMVFEGADLAFPFYAYGRSCEASGRMIAAVREADGVVIGSPGYHGSLSGLVKNALDYLEELSGDARPYLTGRPVACVTTAAGWQAAVNTLGALRNIVHALRGWPTPMGVSICTAQTVFDEAGVCLDPSVDKQLDILAAQVMEGVSRHMRTLN